MVYFIDHILISYSYLILSFVALPVQSISVIDRPTDGQKLIAERRQTATGVYDGVIQSEKQGLIQYDGSPHTGPVMQQSKSEGFDSCDWPSKLTEIRFIFFIFQPA